MNKKNLSERDICTKFITPSIKNAGTHPRFPLPLFFKQADTIERVETLMAACRELETGIESSRNHAADLLKEAFAPALWNG